MRMNTPLAFKRIYFAKGWNVKCRGAYWVARTTNDSLTIALEGNNTNSVELPPAGRGVVITLMLLWLCITLPKVMRQLCT